MSWVTVVWSMIASVCLTLAAMHSYMWSKQRRAWGNLLFALSAVATSLLAAVEFWMMRSETTAQYAAAVRWLHVPAWMLILTLVGFVRLHLRAGRPWLAWTVAGARTLSLVLNFILTPNLNYREITSLRQIPFLGESVSVAQGVSSPWMLIGQASLLLFLVFVVDATVTVWRRADRRQALVLGGSIIFFGAVGMGQAILVFWNAVTLPITATWFYMGIVLAMGYELSREALRATQLAGELQVSEYRMALADEIAQERFRLAVEAAPNAMVMVNREGHIILLNAQAELVFGYTREELLGRPVELLIPDRHHLVHAGYRHRYLLTPAARAMGVGRDLLGRRKDGSEVPVEVVLNPITAPDGTAVLASIIDITERRKSEAEMAQQRNELAHLSRVTMLGELSGSLAHELNQPLTAILSNAQAGLRFLAQNPGNIDEVRHILEDIAEDDKRAGEVIRRLRSLLKKGDVRYGPVDINQVVLDVLKLMHTDLANRNVTVSTELAEGLPMVEGDRVQLQQVVLNLIMNGCDAMDRAPRERRLTLRTTASGGGEVEISVADCGPGIPPENLERIFEPFMSTKADGMGLGLAVCRSIVTAHDGRLWATNNVDRGATLHITLPAREPTE